MNNLQASQIYIYETPEGTASIDVRLEQESVWLTQAQMVELFEKSKKTISEHISNIFKEAELNKDAVVRKSRTTASDGKSYNVIYYNLDVIISVGYRIKSKRGTQFRIWASNVLKNYLIQGYAINEKRLKEQAQKYSALQQAVKLLENVSLKKKELSQEEASGLLKIITDYTFALDILDQFDHQKLAIRNTSHQEIFKITYKEAVKSISILKERLGGGKLFGNEKDESFKSSLNAIYQTFSGEDLYPSIEEKAAHLLYFVVKNHSFSDGNKRIAAFIFVWFLDKNNCLYHANGSKRIADNALVALTLMIAESKAEEKDIMVKIIVNLINKDN
jgi:prophage maintenance system killer protein